MSTWKCVNCGVSNKDVLSCSNCFTSEPTNIKTSKKGWDSGDQKYMVDILDAMKIQPYTSSSIPTVDRMNEMCDWFESSNKVSIGDRFKYDLSM